MIWEEWIVPVPKMLILIHPLANAFVNNIYIYIYIYIGCGGYCGSCNSSSGLECLSCPPSRYMCLHTLPTFGSCVNSCNTECLNYNNKHTYSPLFPLNECSRIPYIYIYIITS